MDLNKYRKNLTLELRFLGKEAHKWTYGDGEGEFTGCYDFSGFNTHFILSEKEIENINTKVLEYINTKVLYCNDYIKENDLFLGNESYLMFNTIEDIDCMTIANTENFNANMYICDYSLELRLNGVILEGEDLIELFPKAEY